MKRLALALVAWCALIGPVVAQTPDAPNPDAQRRALAEAAIRDSLVDPDSARFKWSPQPFLEYTSFRPGLFARTFKGDLWYGCGEVNARNRMGGYAGYQWFDVLLQDGHAVWMNIDAPGDDPPVSANHCAKAGF